MSSLAEIESAVVALPHAEKLELLTFLSNHVAPEPDFEGPPRFLDSEQYPPIDGLPADLSVNTREKVREILLTKRNGQRG